MLKTLFKKKVNEDKLSNVLINSLVHAMEVGFPDISAIINDDVDFIEKPNIKEDDYDKFLFILFVGNLKIMNERLEPIQANRIEELLKQKFSKIYGLEVSKINLYLKEYSKFIGRINYPSKNILYGMSKAIFFKYNLSQFQEDYFKDLNTPNPVFLKRLNEIVKNFIWDWDCFLEKYNFVE